MGSLGGLLGEIDGEFERDEGKHVGELNDLSEMDGKHDHLSEMDEEPNDLSEMRG